MPSIWFTYLDNALLFNTIWFLVVIAISYSTFHLVKYYAINHDFLFTYLCSYLFWQSFILFYFFFHNNLIALILAIAAFLFTQLLYKETKKIDRVATYYELPYLFWIIFMFGFILLKGI